MTGKRRSVVDLLQREVGDLAPRIFAHRAGASEDLVLRLGMHKKLDKHRGCVNTLSFNADGDILVSGSDDRMVMLWDWVVGSVKLSFHSGHTHNVFQARFMPCSDDRTIVTCAADGEVRHAQIKEGGHVVTKVLAQHEGRAHKMAVEPGSPHIFYSCGEDGLVQHFDLRTESASKLFVCKSFQDKSVYWPIVHLNAITIDPRNPNYFAIAGSDEYARVYDIRKNKWEGSTDCIYGLPTDCFCPTHLIGDEQVEMSGLAFSDQSELLASYNYEQIYLFSRDQGLGPNPVPPPTDSDMDADTGDDSSTVLASPSGIHPNSRSKPQAYVGHSNSYTVKGVSFFGPNCEYVVSGSDCGRIFIWRKKGAELLRVMEADRHVVNCIESHPFDTMIASSGIEHNLKTWIPNSRKPAEPINLEEDLIPVAINCFAIDYSDSDYDDGDDDDGDDDGDDDDGDDDDDDDDGDDDDDDGDGGSDEYLDLSDAHDNGFDDIMHVITS